MLGRLVVFDYETKGMSDTVRKLYMGPVLSLLE